MEVLKHGNRGVLKQHIMKTPPKNKLQVKFATESCMQKPACLETVVEALDAGSLWQVAVVSRKQRHCARIGL